MADSSFHVMRDALIARGLLERAGEGFRLTDRGHGEALATIARLREAAPPGAPGKPPRRWNYNRRAFREAALRRGV